MRQSLDTIVNNFRALQDILSKMLSKNKLDGSRVKFKECLTLLKETKDLAKGLDKEIIYDKQQFVFLNNMICGIFDGLNTEKISDENRSYLIGVIEELIEDLELLKGDWFELAKEFPAETIQEKVEEAVEETPKVIVKRGDWKEGLKAVSKNLTTKEQPKAKVEEVVEDNEEQKSNERPDAESINEELWAQDAEKLKSFKESKSKLLKVSRKACIDVPVIVMATLPKTYMEKMEDAGYKVNKVFNLYTLIENMSVVGVIEDIADTRNEFQISVELEKMATKKYGKSMKIISNPTKIKNHYYFLVVPNDLPKNISINEWTFQK